MSSVLPWMAFSEEEMQAFEPAMKIGLLATINPQGQPHLTLISSLKAGSSATVTFGQFIEGLSKQHVCQNPNAAFLIMTLDRQLWRGKARWTHAERSGADYDWYNNVPMFRYNAYFGIHTVHYLDLIAHTGRQALPVNAVVFAALKTMLARTFAAPRSTGEVLNPWTRAFFNKIDNLKFLVYIDQDGFPMIIPVIQAQAGGKSHLLFSIGVYSKELSAIAPGSPVAILGMALTMEDVLVRGVYEGVRRRAGVACSSVAVDWVYNPMPPVPGQIYPQEEVKAVVQF
ncbi:MAG: pyridoxamine 5'-phosphate oxidase family protein [Chloroflexi bacterium]|nr:MAG: pyridoxamine 5'-phosphate oxidase family protein [Chloroflexota bacterium]